ncbi:lipoprotein signal peptidase [Spirochaetia bacterium]|nr:lipoprotein signal peptidase [Spirochaetia bacterium]GHU31491.1 lipoprotein signal peptidase [Spirochaetia bacterium]
MNKKLLLPFSLTAFVIILDQAVKQFIVTKWPLEGRQGRFIADIFGNGFLEIYHVRNKAIAFSLGRNLPDSLRPVLFILVPLAVIIFLIWYYFKSDEFSTLQRWAVAGIIGGGIGNIADRIFRPDGVVDFVSIALYGLLGMDRWPTFNVADSSVVACCGILLISMIFAKRTQKLEVSS